MQSSDIKGVYQQIEEELAEKDEAVTHKMALPEISNNQKPLPVDQ